MKFSQSLDLALHALWFMARNNPEQPLMIKELAERMHSSESYLARVMLGLTKAGIIQSIRGKKGGFVFKKPAEQITVADVVLAVDADVGDFACTWEKRGCFAESGCVLVELFREAQRQMLDVLRRMTIAEIARLAAPAGENKYREAAVGKGKAKKIESVEETIPPTAFF